MDKNLVTTVHWRDTKHIWGMPLSFTRYSLSDTALHITTGFLFRTTIDIPLHRIEDTSDKCGPLQRMMNQGTIKVTWKNRDGEWVVTYIENVKHHKAVKDLLRRQSEEATLRHRYRYSSYPRLPEESAALPVRALRKRKSLSCS